MRSHEYRSEKSRYYASRQAIGLSHVYVHHGKKVILSHFLIALIIVIVHLESLLVITVAWLLMFATLVSI